MLNSARQLNLKEEYADYNEGYLWCQNIELIAHSCPNMVLEFLQSADIL